MTIQTPPVVRTLLPLRWPLFVVYGVFVWLVFLLLVRNVGPLLFVPGSVQLVLSFALLIPIAYLAVWSLTAFGANGATMLSALTVASIPGMLLDAIALTWTDLYGPMAQTGAAWILWGGAWTFIFALVWRKDT